MDSYNLSVGSGSTKRALMHVTAFGEDGKESCSKCVVQVQELTFYIFTSLTMQVLWLLRPPSFLTL